MKRLTVWFFILTIFGCEESLYQQVVRTADLPTAAVLRVVNYETPGKVRLEWDTDPGTDSYELEVMDPDVLPLTWEKLTTTQQNLFEIQQTPLPASPKRYRYRLRKWRGTTAFPYSNHVVGVFNNVSNDSSERNNTQATATPLSWSTSNAIVLFGVGDNSDAPLVTDYDVDWFKVTVPAGRTLTFTVPVPPDNGTVRYRIGTAAAMGGDNPLNAGPVVFDNSSMTDTEFFLALYPATSTYAIPPGSVHYFTTFALNFSSLID